MANRRSCRHFTGIQNDKCEAGVEYTAVRFVPPQGMYRWPCTDPSLRSMCPLFAEYTDAEIKAFDHELAAVLNKLAAFERGESDACLECGEKVTQMRQVGRCVYAEPCGHRLWQGRIPTAWKDRGVVVGK